MQAITIALIISTHTISAHMPFAECLALIEEYNAKMGGMVTKESTPTSRVVTFPIQNLTVVDLIFHTHAISIHKELIPADLVVDNDSARGFELVGE